MSDPERPPLRRNSPHGLGIQVLLSRPLLLSVLILAMASCGRQRTQIEPPRQPASAPQEKSGTVGKRAPGGATGMDDGSGRLPGTGTGAVSLLDTVSSDGPAVRIGLITDASEVLISATGEYYFAENRDGDHKIPVRGQIRIRAERGSGTDTPETCYRIQILSLRNREAAEKVRDDMERQFKVPAVLSENSDATSSRIRVGEFSTREEAQALLNTLKGSGYPDAFIIGDIRFSHNGSAALALRGPDGLFKVNSSGFFFLPSSSDPGFLSLNGKAYRGFLDIRLNGSGRITAVNRLNIEQYLLGVVPAEMSPYEYPEFDALAAQSIAARTYALKHMGHYESQGFDLTDDTRTQVYGGVAYERDATNEAVQRTAGIAIYYDNQLIDAMYMSTCGGRTEDFSEVYDAPPVPYLTSVICTSEEGVHDDAITITGSHKLIAPIQTKDGRIANRDLELAVILGIVEPGLSLSEDYLTGPISEDESIGLVRAARQTLGSSGNGFEPESTAHRTSTRIGFLAAAAESLFGFEEIRRNITSVDAAYYLDNLEDGDAVPKAAHRTMAFLMQKALWRPFPDNTVRPDEPMSRAEAFSLILQWVESMQPDILRQGLLSGINGSQNGSTGPAQLQIKWGNNLGNFPLAADLTLFRKEGELEIPVTSLKVIGNEKSYFHLNSERNIDFLEIELNPTGASSDRYSPLATWDTTLTRSDANDKLRNLVGNIGDIVDLQPARIGKSGRVVQVQVVGSRSSRVVNGYKVRGALGLRDTLYTITRKKNPAGDVETFTFHGRGYGHGIGLCQVGAFGMAKAGKNFEEILKTYYQGVEVRKAY